MQFRDRTLDKTLFIVAVVFAIVRSLWVLRSSYFGGGSSFVPEGADGAIGAEQVFDDALAERVRFDATGWTFVSRDDRTWLWCDELANMLGLQVIARNLGPVEPDFDVVSYCRENMSFGSSLVEARLAQVNAFRGFVYIEKSERPPGYAYVGRLHVLLGQQTVVCSVVANERGVTGIREATVVPEALKEGRITIPTPTSSGTKVPGWFVDPCDPTRNHRTICSIADDPKYDARFPGHPLSRIRQTLGQIEASFQIRSAVPEPGDPWPHPPLTASDDQPATIH